MKKIGLIDVVGVQYTLYTYGEGEFKNLQEDAAERDRRYLEEPHQNNIDGYCDYTAKEIRVYDDSFTDRRYFEMTLRHEMTHALLYEIGNSNYADEDYVDKISKWSMHLDEMYTRGKQIIDIKRRS